MSEVIINDLTRPHYKEFWKLIKNFNQLEQEMVIRTIPTELLELELDRRQKKCCDMVQQIYSVIETAEKENMFTNLDDLEAVCKAFRSITTKGQPITITPAQASDTERNGVKLILAQTEMESQDG